MSETKQIFNNKKAIVFAVPIMIVLLVGILFLKDTTPKTSKADIARTLDNKFTREPVEPAKKFKILHVMSYHSPWKWTDDQLEGFKEALSGLDVQYKIFQMDTKRQSSEQWKLKVSAEAQELVTTWKPDLVFTNDDDAQIYFAKHYVNTDIPFIFSAVNADPAEYGFEGSKNVTGVLERMHFVQTVRLLKQLVPSVRKIAIITDSGKMWDPMIKRLKRSESQLPQDVKIIDYHVLNTFKEFRETVTKCHGSVDAVGFLGVFEFKDENGSNVPLEQVQRWIIENSMLPDFSFWKDRVDKGTLCAVTVSGLAQGQAAGQIARDVLLEGRSPASFPMKATEKGIPIINLARAKKLNLNPNSSVLLMAEVVTEISE
ncbi:MAG: hypothetical protein JW715_02100 [Sedimentisphaerales bacterium]|nr:hypothetical protein [Sedimentisphaerales bacterium]